jgi:hypothetical protein
MLLINPPADLEIVLIRLAQLMAIFCRTEMAAIWPIVSSSGALIPAIALNLPLTYEPRCEAALLSRCCGTDYEHGERWAVADAGEDNAGIRSVYALRLFNFSGQLLGILMLYFTKPFEPSPELIQVSGGCLNH